MNRKHHQLRVFNTWPGGRALPSGLGQPLARSVPTQLQLTAHLAPGTPQLQSPPWHPLFTPQQTVSKFRRPHSDETESQAF